MNTRSRFLILITGHPIPEVQNQHGGFTELYTQGLLRGEATNNIHVDSIDLTVLCNRESLPDPILYQGILMTGSPVMLAEKEPWMALASLYVSEILDKKIPFLGVCLGHQLLGQTLGGKVGPNPQGREIGTVSVQRTGPGDAFLDRMPMAFQAQATHMDVILELPGALEVVGTAPHDPHHMVRAGSLAWGVQFHPEFSADIIAAYLRARRPLLESEQGADAFDRKINKVEPTVAASLIFSWFRDFALDHQLSVSGQQNHDN
jgi:GMP synthase (glutamine-hydrolysing)